MNLVIDSGNTCIKVSIFNFDQELSFHERFRTVDQIDFSTLLDKFDVKKCIISTVSHPSNIFLENLPKSIEKVTLSNKISLPIENNYKTAKTLGTDRIAVACAGNMLYPDSNVLIFDAGSALTYEFVNNKGQYLGGGISPGLNMRFKALSEFTARLPLVGFPEEMSMLGNSTEKCIQMGVGNGIICEMEGIISMFEQYYSNLRVILTGGDSDFFVKNLKNSIFAVQFLVEIGLNRILNYNVK